MSFKSKFPTLEPAYTKADVDALIAELDADPANTEKMFTFGKSLYGRVPFPAKLFKEAQGEMLYRYDMVHIPQADAQTAAAAYDGRDGDADDARHRASNMRYAKDRFSGQSDQNASMMGKLAHDARIEELNAFERQQMWAQQAAEAERQHVEQMVADKNRIVAVTVQIGTLNQPVAAPKVAKFKPRALIPSR